MKIKSKIMYVVISQHKLTRLKYSKILITFISYILEILQKSKTHWTQ